MLTKVLVSLPCISNKTEALRMTPSHFSLALVPFTWSLLSILQLFYEPTNNFNFIHNIME